VRNEVNRRELHIGIMGATGTVGRHVALMLADEDVRCTALTRHRPDASSTTQWRAFDWDDESTWDNALNGLDRLFVVSPLAPNMVELTTALAPRIVDAGVGYAVRLSALGVGYEPPLRLGQLHGEADRILSASLPVMSLRPNSFMDNFYVFSAATIRDEGVLRLAQGDGAVSAIDARDIARVASVLLAAEAPDIGALELTGPQALTNAAMSTCFGAALSKVVSYEPQVPETTRESMLGYGMPVWLVDVLCELDAMVREGRAAQVNDNVARICGHDARTFEMFVRSHRYRFEATKA
jgi:uncharacterized protein YbjT (DUF2867 family)